MLIICPHCQTSVEVPKIPQSGEILCDSCGSTFRVESEATVTWGTENLRTLGRFELITRVGAGSFGIVYRARDPGLDRIVALKVPRAGQLLEASELDRFLREARSAAQFRHPAIVPVLEVGQAEGMPYIVSEFIEGVTLSDRLTAGRPSFRESAEILAVVATAIDEAHRRGVVHRDIKPSNLMIRPDGSPMVMDFGLARRESGEVTMTMEGQVLGTPAYMSPEQAKGQAHMVDGRSDVYSLGVVLYQMLTGEVPFRGNSRMLIHQVLNDDPRPPRNLNDRIPRDLETITLKAMAKEPSRRYATARELAEDLRHFQAGEPIKARPSGPVERALRWCRRNPTLTISAAVVAGLLFVVVALSVLFGIDRQIAAGHLREALGKAEKQRIRSESLSSEMALGRGISLAEQGDSPRGLLWMARSLALAPDDPSAESTRFAARANLSSWAGTANRTRLIVTTPQENYNSRIPYTFSPDGKLFASFGTRARLWRTSDGMQVGPDMGVPNQVPQQLVFSPDGSSLLTAGWSPKDHLATVQLWRTSDGSAIGEAIRSPAIGQIVLGFRPDGKAFATARTAAIDNKKSEVRLWSTGDGSPIGEPQVFDGAPYALAFHPDGKSFLVGGTSGLSPFLDATTGRPTGKSPANPGFIYQMAFSPDGRSLLTAGLIARLWSLPEGTPKGSPIMPSGENNNITAIAFSPDGRTFATSDRLSKTIRLWSAVDASPIGREMVHQQPVFSLAYRPDGRVLVSASADGTSRLWSALDGSPIGPPTEHEGQVLSAAFSPDGETVLSGTFGGVVRIWSPAEGVTIERPLSRKEWSGGATFSPDGTRFLTRGRDNSVRVWDVKDETLWGRPMEHSGTVISARFSVDGKWIITVSVTPDRQGQVRCWDASTGLLIGKPIALRASNDTVSLSHDGQTLLIQHTINSGPLDADASLWRVADGLQVGGRMPQAWNGAKATFLPGGKMVLTLDDDGRAMLWSTADGSLIRKTSRTPGTCRYLAIRPDGQAVALASGPTLRLWATDGSSPEKEWTLRFPVSCLQFSPDGKTLVTGCGDYDAAGELQFRGGADGSPIGKAIPYRSRPIEATFSPDGATVFGTSQDGTSRLCKVADGSAFGKPISHRGPLTNDGFSPDGRLVLTNGWDAISRLWSVADGSPIGPPLTHRLGFREGKFRQDGRAVLTMFEEDARLWLVPPPISDDRAGRVSLWAEVLTGLELDETGAVNVLDGKGWAERRLRLEALGGSPMPADREEVTPRDRHLREAALAERDESWFAARWHLSRLIHDSPAEGGLLARRAAVESRMGLWKESAEDSGKAIALGEGGFEVQEGRGQALAEMGRWAEAADAFAEAARLGPDALEPLYPLVTSQLGAGRREDYRRECAGMMQRVRAVGSQTVKEVALYRCVWSPRGVLDFPELLRLADLDESRLDPRIRGPLLYRLDRPEEAIRLLDEVKASFPRRAWDWLFVAMIQQRLGHQAEARQALDRAVRWIEVADQRAKAPDGSRWFDWRERLEVQFLLEEARRMIEPGPVTP